MKKTGEEQQEMTEGMRCEGSQGLAPSQAWSSVGISRCRGSQS